MVPILMIEERFLAKVFRLGPKTATMADIFSCSFLAGMIVIAPKIILRAKPLRLKIIAYLYSTTYPHRRDHVWDLAT
jgi:hypothetical protein